MTDQSPEGSCSWMFSDRWRKFNNAPTPSQPPNPLLLSTWLLLIASLITVTAVNAAPIQVTVTVMRVTEVSCDDGDFTICPDDYYGRVNIAGQGFQETNNTEFEDQPDVSPFWTFTRTTDTDLGTIPIQIQIWDDDDGSDDDILDVSSGDSDRTIDLTFNLATGTWTGDVPENIGFSSGSHAAVMFDVSLSGNGDIDGDGIPDGVERFGVRNANGTLTADLAAMGADPCRKTVAVELDFMEDLSLGHTHRPLNAAIAEAIAAYNAAPVPAVSNCPYPGFPTQASGVNLIVNIDDALPESANLTWGAGAEAVRDANFSGTLRPYFHYSLWVHNQAMNNGSSGLCCSDSGKDALVSLGSWVNSTGNVRDQSGTFLHELGHALGFGHGGGDGINCKPNYLSVMSYTLQVTGIPDPTLADFNVDLDSDGINDARLRLDHSRSQLPTLDETALIEGNGIGDGTDLASWSIDVGATTLTAPGNGPIDWNQLNGIEAGSVAVDLNNFGFRECGTDGATPPVANPVPNEILIGFDDWANLKYRAALSPDAGFTPASNVVEIDFLTAETIKAQMAATLQADPSVEIAAAPSDVLTGSNVAYTITLANNRPIQADDVVVSDNLPANLSFVSCAASGGGVCGGSGNARTASFATLAGNSTQTITLIAEVLCEVADGTNISNSVIVNSDTPDFDSDNNLASVVINALNPPPVISGESVDQTTLWPPNHKMRDIAVSYEVTDNCGVPVVTLDVTSNEPVNGTGDGNTAPDWIVLDTNNVELRAERKGNGSGRVYTTTITATDSGGGSASKQVEVSVPRNQ